MQSGSSDMFINYEPMPVTPPLTSIPPAGSRLAIYLRPNNAMTSRPCQFTGMSTNRPSANNYSQCQNSVQMRNVPNFLPTFAQMGISDEKDLNSMVPQYSIASQPPHNNVTTAMVDHLLPNHPMAPVDSSSAPGYMHETYGGTVYYYPSTSEVGRQQEKVEEGQAIVTNMGNFVYRGPTPHIGKFKAKGASFFVPQQIKMELVQRQLAIHCVVESGVDVPLNVEYLHNIVPLEKAKVLMTSEAFPGYTTTVYKAISARDGLAYCLRRIHNFQLVSSKQLALADNWKKLVHVNVVQLRDVIPTHHFGDSSLLFVYDYYPLSETLKERHLESRINGFTAPFAEGTSKIATVGGINPNSVQESVIWTYVVQISSALRAIHGSNMSARSIDLTKITAYGTMKVMLSACGVLDVLMPDANSASSIQNLQQEDLNNFGRVLISLISGNSQAVLNRENLVNNTASIFHQISPDLRNLISFLLGTSVQSNNRLRSINDVMPMIGARFYSQLETVQMRNDALESEFSKELENGRLFRLLCKLNSITERAEFQLDARWSETGDRYLLKLFRDYMFHQVTESGKPYIDMAHVISCLNKLDAGLAEKIQLVSRDGENILIASYSDLRRCMETAFSELQTASAQPTVNRVNATPTAGRR